ncbi:MAG: hypothetical protein K2X38_03915 [Gemmataceae bacterium]|nr:hypothetical protein [Gemmataceae bacterium]
MMILSVYVEAQKEAEAFKWIESQKAGYDLCDVALRRWVREHWWGFLRERWIQHLQGSAYWMELDRGDFGLLNNAFLDKQELLHPILNSLKNGLENLDVILWAQRDGLPMEDVINILEALDINSRRLSHQFDD